ncbi:MAG TPA: excinuclease ABC subunit UvrA, partial [Gammaproteobacteria bacterium]|nr:excinuclease ABC subunit UvrA [Gammaproteobacteria bacterium]
KSTSHNPRSTVGTITEVYDYLRLLYARAGDPRCPDHDMSLEAQTVSQMVDQVLALPESSKILVLAPMISDRKGEHLHVFQELKSQGFIRVRVDGLVVDLDEVPTLDKKKKHSVDAVVDRLKVDQSQRLRLAESIETALNLSEGQIVIQSMDDSFEPMMFSSKFACSVCGYSIPELEPRIFSFNSPFGACPTCDGLGAHQFFDPDRLIVDPELSLSSGAIKGWDRRSMYYYHLLKCLARHYGFSLDSEWQDLSVEHQNKVLYGSDDESIDFSYVSDRGREVCKNHAFEGVIRNLERRYKETDSQSQRDELAKLMTQAPCPDCGGSRLNIAARNVFIDEARLPDLVRLPIGECYQFFEALDLPGRRQEIADKILKEIQARLGFLINVGLDYLSLDRSAETLSGGEAQRIRLASQIGAGLVGVMYILDEPSIGLHQRDNERLLNTLFHLRDLGNTVIVVEHDEDAIRSADYLVDIGPGAGVHGGQIVAAGTPVEVMSYDQSVTGQYLSGKKQISVPERRAPKGVHQLTLEGCSGNNLQNVTLNLPLGLLTCVTGVSGSGKSSLINRTLYPHAAKVLNKATTLKSAPFLHCHGIHELDKVVDIDQSPIGRTPRSNPATYTGLFTPIREIYAETQEARSRGYTPGRFSFNVKGGRCETCQGDGLIKVEMHFLPDIYVPCDTCKGLRYNRETLDIRYKGKSIHDVLQMTVEDAREFFDAIPTLARKLQTLVDVGLSYLKLGQSATTLSGGEAQRVKLSRELSKRDTGRTLYILDEPTTGLHFEDIKQLLAVLHRLRDHGNTVVIIEHNLDVIKTADWIIDLGPEGGSGGGQIIVEGTPEYVASHSESHTGRFLTPLLERKKSA